MIEIQKKLYHCWVAAPSILEARVKFPSNRGYKQEAC